MITIVIKNHNKFVANRGGPLIRIQCGEGCRAFTVLKYWSLRTGAVAGLLDTLLGSSDRTVAIRVMTSHRFHTGHPNGPIGSASGDALTTCECEDM